ncbi:RL2 [Human alphaherpesvirus 1]|nr:RL2 [Human alphaherpesvirus 1]UPH93439.1 RL2 [Human alphaherpesvirus 1]UPH94044.1 RL2 [Human alphaherpesvirus 1]UPH94047.1 RL2 [Human alphaherpesvirus 1]UXY89502.1 RL2 [Human alphaherpesvirus 1]
MEPRPGASTRRPEGRPQREPAPDVWVFPCDRDLPDSSDSEAETEVGGRGDADHHDDDSASEADSTDTELFETGLLGPQGVDGGAVSGGSPPREEDPGSCGGAPPREDGGSDEGDVCAVCTDEIAPHLRCDTFPCMHRFCIPCMKTWMQLRNTCPLCNAKLVYLIVGVTPSGSFSTIPIVNDPQTRMEAEEAVRAGTAVDFIWTGNQRFAPRYLTLGGHTVRALSPTHPEPTTDEDDDDLDDADYVPPAPRRTPRAPPRRGAAAPPVTGGASHAAPQPAAARTAPPSAPIGPHGSSNTNTTTNSSGGGGGSRQSRAAAPRGASGPSGGVGVGVGVVEAEAGRPRGRTGPLVNRPAPLANNRDPIVISDSPPASPHRPPAAPMPGSAPRPGPPASSAASGPARPRAAVAPCVRAPPPGPGPRAPAPGAEPAARPADARRVPQSHSSLAQAANQEQSLCRARATVARGSGGPGVEGGHGPSRGAAPSGAAPLPSAVSVEQEAAVRPRKRRGSGQENPSPQSTRPPLAPAGAKRAATHPPSDSGPGGRGQGGPGTPLTSSAASASSSSASSSSAPTPAGAASSAAGAASSSASASSGGAVGALGGRQEETSLGPRAASGPRGPRKCARKTRHAETSGAVPAGGLTRYLPISGVSSVVALSPYVNKTITGDCLPILDMETGNIGAYVVLVDQTGNMATRLRAAVPGWSRRTLLPETAGNHVMPPEYPTAPASEWNSLWMTPVGNMLFDQGTLVGALDFRSLRSRHPWSGEQGASTRDEGKQ